jgi:hypothetical protein
LSELIEFFEKINLINGHPPSSCMALKQGPNWGYWAQNAVKVVKIHQNFVFSVVIIGLYDPKTGSTLGLSGPKPGHNWVVVPLTLNHDQIWVISPITGS